MGKSSRPSASKGSQGSKGKSRGKKGDNTTMKAVVICGVVFGIVLLVMLLTPGAPEKLKHTVLRAGDGYTYPKKGDVVAIHYDGYISSSGQLFDSSTVRKEPFEFQVGNGQVLKGWDKALPKMSLGEKAKLEIHSDWAFGKNGFKDKETKEYRIPPDTGINVEMTLVAVNGEMPAVYFAPDAAEKIPKSAMQNLQTTQKSMLLGFIDTWQDDATDSKPSDWDQPEEIEAVKPDSWDEEEDGEWVTEMVKNPAFKGEWKAARIPRPGVEAAMRDVLGSAQYSYSGDLLFRIHDMNQSAGRAAQLGLDSKQCGEGKCFAIISAADDATYVFPAGAAPVTASDVSAWIGQWKAKELKPFVLSADPPATPWTAGEVATVVGTTFDEVVMDEKKDVLIEFYAPWCGHCKALEPKYKELAERFTGDQNVVIAKTDRTANDPGTHQADFKVEAFPTIYLAPASTGSVPASPILYDGERETDALENWVQAHRITTAAASEV